MTMKIREIANWTTPVVTDDIPHGDMPGDKVEIKVEHIKKANIIFPELLKQIKQVQKQTGQPRLVVAVCGGSGVGKSETASLLSYYLNKAGIGCYTLSGDNYPYRIPHHNDEERLRVFRTSAIEGLLEKKKYSQDSFKEIYELQKTGEDASEAYEKENPWFVCYRSEGRRGLEQYLGSDEEIDFRRLSGIITSFKGGTDHIWLKRMGRTAYDMWYDNVDFADIDVLLIEWTHGNSDLLHGVDIPILLNSTPEETLAHRKERNRDGGTDSPFTTLILEIEQKMLIQQAHKAKIIVSNSGDLLDYQQYCELMKTK